MPLEEIWKPIAGYEGLYEVSSLGNVKSYSRYPEGKLIKPSLNKYGYLDIQLYKKTTCSQKLVHRLVAEAFIPNPENKPQVDHINKERDDNRVENLQWLTASENVRKGFIQGRVISEKTRQKAILCCKKTNEIISTWINKEINLEFIGSASELTRAFPEQNLSHITLNKVRRKERAHHKGWTIKS